MQIAYIVIDDFLEDPDGLRIMAEKCDFPHLDKPTYFPGRNSQQHVPITGLEEHISNILHEPLEPIPGSSHHKFRLAFEGDKGLDGVHVDEAHWTGILYLSKPEHCKGGTDLFRHIRTNTDHAPINKAELDAMGYETSEKIFSELLMDDTNDLSKWELTTSIPMRYNRLVLIRPWQWHDAGAGFGDSLENGRLVYLMSFRNKEMNDLGR
jgi:hypothetical protein